MDALGLTEQLAGFVIRPPRASYTAFQLGETIFEYKGIIYQRVDFTVPAQSPTTLKLQGSIYMDRANKNKAMRPTVLYLHANSSSRLTVKNYLKNLIQYFDVVAFDFRGCGISEGKYLTLGYLQKYDVKAVIQYVQAKYEGQRKWMIWGRSMGAVTAILFTAKFMGNSEKIVSLVLDSPFADLQKIIYFLADKKLPLLPKFVVDSAIDNLEKYTKQRIQAEYHRLFLIRKHKPVQQIVKIRVPIFFIGSKNDQIIDSKHVQILYNNAYTKKQLQMLQGGHNQARPEHLKNAVIQFLNASLNMKKQSTIRKKIFQFAINRASNIFNQENQKKQPPVEQNNEITKPKSKSRPKNRLFRQDISFNDGSFNHQKSNISLNQSYRQQTKQQKSQRMNSKKQTKQTHQQILNKVLPQTSSRRSNRIFTPNYTKDKQIDNKKTDIL